MGEAVDLLLAVDDLDTALPILLARAARPLAAPATRAAATPDDGNPDPFADTGSDDDEDDQAGEILQDAVRLVRLGAALDRAELTEAGLAAARRVLPALRGWIRDDRIADLADALRHGGRAATSEDLVLASFPGDGKDTNRVDRLTALARIYHAAGRHADVLALLEQAPGWGAQDLAELVHGQGHHDADLPLAVIAGEALAAAGRTGPARAAAVAVLAKDPSCDPAYALLVRLDGPAAVRDLERRAAASPLEERPLVWLARVRLDAGDVAGAATAAEQAMAMDPSDGDEGPGDRFRARAVLADVRERQGRSDEAATLRTAVASIRAAERTDRLMAAGLTTRAVVGYQQALTLNANAYCIQSRLARELARLGRHAEAEAHYQRAFEIMPRAFGRRESHCFGCEGAFAGLRAQAIAERVFIGRLEKDPANPRLHYLLGILRQEQDRHAEAAASYARALALDPDYYTAARRLIGLAAETDIPAAVRETAALTMARLDPARRYAQGERPVLRDLARLWRTYADLPPAPEAAPERILPLVAPAAPQDPWMTRMHRQAEPAGIPTPAEAVAAQQPLAAIVNNLR
jgi:tetratricopeptide (TPR) repeat protein